MKQTEKSPQINHVVQTLNAHLVLAAVIPPIANYSLSTVCPACNAPTIRRACKVRCTRCGFMWDCSEL
jgi:hypothetical protein